MVDNEFIIRELYKRVVADSDGDSQLILEFLNWLHYEKDEVKFLVGMEGLTNFERQYMEQLLQGKIPRIKNK